MENPREEDRPRLSSNAWKYAHLGRGRASDHPLYSTWEGMRGRCYDRSHRAYPWYGARGVTVCDRWDSFWDFVEDVGEKPDPKYTLDRIRGSEGYGPGNVRWADKSTQSRNQKLDKRNVSGYSGIAWFARTSSWMVRVVHQNRQYHIGYFQNLEDAVAARLGANEAILEGVFTEAYLASLADRKLNAPFVTNTSGVRGVHWDVRHQKWIAFGYTSNRRVSLGSFDSLEDACRRRQEFVTEKENGNDHSAASRGA